MIIRRNRRGFLRNALGVSLGTSTLVGIDAIAPRFLLQAAKASGQASESILVVVQLSGGNDGLNTVIPFRDDEYRKQRPELSIGEGEVLGLTEDLGLHPAMRGFADLHEDGLLTIVQGVGYDQPNRSHFESMDIWHTCHRKTETRLDGWLGRFLEIAAPDGDVPALHFGRNQQPLALHSRQLRVPSVQSLDEFRLKGANRVEFRQLIEELAEPANSREEDDLLGFIETSTSSALVASRQVEHALKSYTSSFSYPETELAKKLSIVAQLIDSGLSTRIYYVELDGFDTHAAQAETHAILLKEWSDAVSTFVRDVTEHGHGDRVCVMSFSEFGRRVSENASGGTDHGAAAPMLLAGGGLQAGITGAQPSLTDLVDGDLKHSVDFRRVYAAVLRDWLLADPTEVIGGDFSPLSIFEPAV